jgi:hypothetical protein
MPRSVLGLDNTNLPPEEIKTFAKGVPNSRSCDNTAAEKPKIKNATVKTVNKFFITPPYKVRSSS